MIGVLLLVLPMALLCLSCGTGPLDAVPTAPPLAPAAVVIDDIRNLGTLGGPASAARDVNVHGHVVGASSDASGRPHGFLWTESGGMEDLGPGAALRINDRGEVLFLTTAGYSIWSRDRGFSPTGLAFEDTPYDMNNLGHIVGKTAGNRAFLWKPDSGIEILEVLGEGWSEATALNDLGEIVGIAETDKFSGAFFLEPGGMPSNLELYPGALLTIPVGVNRRGQVLGTAFMPTGVVPQRAFLWNRSSGIVDIALGTAAAINDRGHVVGTTLQKKGAWNYAFYWEPETGLRSLRWLVPRPIGSRAYGMNDTGMVVGTSTWSESNGTGRTNATLWSLRPGRLSS